MSQPEFETTEFEDAEELEAQARYLLSDANSIRVYLENGQVITDAQRTELAQLLEVTETLAKRVETLFDEITPENYEAE